MRDVVVQAVVSEIVSRIFSSVIDNLLSAGTRDADDAHRRRRLELVVRQIGNMVTEAERRYITDPDLLAQVKELSGALYRGLFALDDARTAAEGNKKRSLALICSPFNAAKRARLTSLILGGGSDGATTTRTERRPLATVVEELEILTGDYMRGFILLVQGYPLRNNEVHRGVTTTLFMDRHVFGRYAEKERIVAFLLQPAHPSRAAGLSALAVAGTHQTGKTTLVKHVCADERVRDHFTHIQWFESADVLLKGGLPDQTEWWSGGPEYLAGVRRILDDNLLVGRRSLLVFEDACPVDDSAWAEMLLSFQTSALAEGSKLLFTCRDAGLARMIGTAEPVVLGLLQQEEYWYYFKAFAFGGVEPRDHPGMAAVARDISHHVVNLRSSFLDGRVLGTLLRDNFHARFWSRVLAAIIGHGRCQHCPPHLVALLDLLPIKARIRLYTYVNPVTTPWVTLQDVLSASASFSGSGTSGLGSVEMDEEASFTVRLCRDILYTDRWYSITLEKDDGRPRQPVHICRHDGVILSIVIDPPVVGDTV